MSIIIESTLEETILEKCKVAEVKNFRGGYRRNFTDITTLEGVEVGLGTENIQVILAEMTKVAVVGPDETEEIQLNRR